MNEQVPSDSLLRRLMAISECKHCNVGSRQAASDAIALIKSLQDQVTELNTVGADYDKALCDITMNLDEPRSAKCAQKALDKHALGTPQ